jgi:hypothetical protein
MLAYVCRRIAADHAHLHKVQSEHTSCKLLQQHVISMAAALDSQPLVVII